MANRGMFATTDLLEPLAQRGIRLSSSQVYRLVVDRPERLSLKILMALLDILDCRMEELIEPVAAAKTAVRKPPVVKRPHVGDMHKRARITRVQAEQPAALTAGSSPTRSA
jgi:DNA-binding Xre family transcriptional regulator